MSLKKIEALRAAEQADWSPHTEQQQRLFEGMIQHVHTGRLLTDTPTDDLAELRAMVEVPAEDWPEQAALVRAIAGELDQRLGLA